MIVGSKIKRPESPTREGYTFVGWHDGNGFWNFDTDVVEETTTLRAVWTPTKYSITYELGGGENAAANPTVYTVESAPAALGSPARGGYEFAGWYLDASYTEAVTTLPVSSLADLTFFAKWTPITYGIVYELGGGTFSAGAVSSYTPDDGDITLPSPTRRGYNFLGWTSEGVDTPTKNLVIEAGSYGEKYFTANWEYNTYTLTFDLGGGTTVELLPDGYSTESDDLMIEAPTRVGYTFLGWVSEEGDTPILSLTIPTGSIGDRSYTATWRPIEYTIELLLGGGSLGTSFDASYTIEADTLTLPDPARPGYTFAGWTSDGVDTPTKGLTIAAGSVGDRSFTAHWTIIVYRIELVLGGGTVAGTLPDGYTVTSGDITLPTLTKHGYTFLGWMENGEGEALLDVTISAGSVGDKSYTAKWEINTYDITVDHMGGTLLGAHPKNYTVESEDIVLPAAEKRGFTFLGWSVNGAEPVLSLTVDTDRAEHLTIVAVFEIRIYIIVYVGAEGATNPNATEYTVESATITLTDPTKRGYTFLGWTSDGVDTPTKGLTVETGSIGERSFTAHFAPTVYTLTFKTEGGTFPGTLPESYTVESGELRIPNLTKDGYTFLGWMENGGEPTKDLVIPQGSVGDRAYTAVFETIEYKIEYELNGGSFNVEFDECYDIKTDTITLPSPEKPGYTFVGWTADGQGEPTVGLTIPAGSFGDKSFTANWVIITYTITLPAGVEIPTSYTVESDDIHIPNPTKRGFTFLGWSINGAEELVKDAVIPKGSTGDKHFEAMWEINTYKITLDLADGTLLGTLPKNYTVESEDIVLPAAEKTGYTFRGWRVNGEFVEEHTIEAGSVGDVTLEAVFEIIKHTITYLGMEGALNPNGAYYTIESGAVTLLAPTKPGYTFLGWTYEGVSEPTADAVIPEGATGEYTFTANWEIITYTLDFDTAGGELTTGARPKEYTVLSDAIAVPNAEKAGYTFLGWALAGGEPTKDLVIAQGSVGDRAYVAVFEPIRYTITYGGMDGAENPNPTYYTVKSGKITLLAPTKPGYTFTGWLIAGEGEAQMEVEIPAGSMGDLTFTANWEIITYTLDFDTADGTVTGNLPGEYTVLSDAISIPNPVRNGYTFLGWVLFGGEPQKDLVIPQGSVGDRAYVAEWEIIEYKIEYELNGGSFSVDFDDCYNVETDTITLPSPEKPGYTFTGWSDGEGEPTVGLTIPAGSFGDKSFTANWQIITYKVEISLGDGSYEGTIPTSYTVESDDFTLPIPTKRGHTFIGWTYGDVTTPQRTVTISKGSITGDLVFTAHWELTKYEITYVGLGNATHENPAYYTMESGTVTITAPTRYGFTFLGWSLDGSSELSMTVTFDASLMRDVTLTAKWEAYAYPITYYGTKGASNPNPAVYVSGDALALEPLSLSGYTFLGWYDEAGNKVEEISIDATGALAFTAKWQSTAAATSGLTYTLSADGTYYIVGTYSGSAANIVIPSTYNGLPVKEIAANAFSGSCRNYIKTVVISDGIEKIGASAFASCQYMTSLTIGADVKSIGDKAFSSCLRLENIYFNAVSCGPLSSTGNHNTVAFQDVGKSVASCVFTVGKDVRVIPDYLFYVNSSNESLSPRITSIVFEEGSVLEKIGYRSFYHLGGVKSIDLPASLKTIGGDAFYYSGITELTLPEGLTEIGNYAFEYCQHLTSVTIPSTVTKIGSSAFSECRALTAIYYNAVRAADIETSSSNVFRYCGYTSGSITLYIGEKVEYIPNYLFCPYSGSTSYAPYITKIVFAEESLLTEIGKYAFAYVWKLESVTLPASLEKLGEYAFYNCYNLVSVDLGGTEEIARYAFSNCSKLEALYLSASIKTIGQNAFASCSALTEIHVPSLSAWCGISFYDQNANPLTRGTASLYVGGEKLTALTIPEGTTAIGDYVFYGLDIETVVIPASVKKVGKYAFANCTKLKNVILPGVTEIGDYAFQSCSAIESVSMPAATAIGNSAFYQCSSLASVSFGTSLVTIGNSAFGYCRVLTEITMPASLTEVGSGAFSQCTGLVSVHVTDVGAWCDTHFGSYDANPLYYAKNLYVNGTLLTDLVVPGTVETMGAYVFYHYPHLKSVVISDGVKFIGASAFLNCKALTSVSFGNTVETVAQGAFLGCTSLTSVTLPGSVQTVSSQAFQDCSSLASVALGEGVTTIGSSAFENCTSLAGIVIPDSVKSIGQNAFQQCSALTSLTIGKGLTSIGSYAFRYCYMLESVYYNAAKLGNLSSGAYVFYRAGKNGDGITLTIGKDVTAIPAYLFHSTSNDSDYAKLVAVELEEGAAFTSIGAYAFYYMKELTSIEIPASVTSIGNYAFQQCVALTSLTLPDSVKSIGDYAFSYCHGLLTLDLGDGLTTMGKNAFYYCLALSEITIPGTCKTVNNYAFAECRALESVILSEGVTTVGPYAFQNCVALKEVTLPSTLTSIGSQAFKGCVLLSDIDLPAGLTSLGEQAFSGCTALKTVTLPTGMTSVGYYAFQNCKELSEIVIPEGVTSIGNYAFQGCTGLKKVTLPSTLTSIGQYAFDGCTALSEIALPEALQTVNNYAFRGCTALSSVVIPDSVTYIGQYAFQSCTGLKTLTLGAGVTTLGNYAFADCTGLTAIHFNAAKLTNLSNNNNIFTRAGTAGEGIVFTFGKEITHVPAYLLCPVADNTYASAMKLASVVFPEDSLCTSFGPYAFAYTTGLKSFTMPKGFVNDTFGTYAFAYCRDLEGFVLPAGLVAVPASAFQGCVSLKSVTIPESVTAIHSYAFYECASLSEITIGKNVTSLGSYAFGNCYGLRRVYLEATEITSYSSSGYYFQNAGRDAAGITLYVGKGVKAISPYLFYGGSNISNAPKLTGIVFAEDGVLSTIGNQCFYNAIYLHTVTIPSTVTTIGNYAFQGCTGLIEVENLSSLTLTMGATDNGYVAYYAKNVYTATEGESKLVTMGGVIYFVDTEKGYYYAVGAVEGATELTFVESLEGHTYEILANAFRGRTDIKKVTFTSGITSIGDYAFYGCTGISELLLPGNITSLGQYVFAYCSGLTEIVIPDTVTSIGSYAFYNCTGVRKLVIGKEVSSFGTYAFGNLTSLEVLIVNSAKLPANLGSNNYVFYNAGKDTEGGMTVTFGNEVKTVPSYMFSPSGNTTYAPKIREVIFLEGSVCTTIGNYAFAYATLYKITLPESLTSIGNQAFAYCYYLEEVVINSKSLVDLTSNSQIFYYAGRSGDGFTVTFGPLVERVPAYLFYVGNTGNAANLLSVTFAEGSVCKTIGQNAFYRNTYLTKVTLPAGLTAIGTDAFCDCTALSEVHVASLADWLAISFGNQLANPASIGTLYIGGEPVPENLVIPEGIESIGDYAFVGNKTIKTLTLPASLKSIGIYAFYNCPGLTELSVNAETVGHHAFYYLTSLKKLTIGAGVKTIALEAFASCAALEEIYFLAESCTLDAMSNTYASIFYNAGSGTEGGVRVVIGKDVAALPAYLFASSYASSAPRLASVSFEAGSSCAEIGQYAFYNCGALEEVTLPASCKTVGHLAFSGCTGLVSVDLGGSESIGERAFSGCTSLKNFKADHLMWIDNYAFYNCTALEGFVIGDLVTFVGGSAFEGCTSLRYIALGKSLETIGNNFLSGTTALVEIYYNAKSFTVYNYYNTPFYGAGSADGITLTVGRDVVAIPDYLFYVDNSSYTPAKLKTVVFEEGSACKKIGLEAFAGVKTLTSVTLPEGLTEIGDYAFYGCTALTDVNLPATLEHFGQDVFSGCGAIAYSVYGGVNYLGNSENPFLIAISVADEGEIENLVIHPDARIVNDSAFQNCTAIKTVTFGNKLVTIGRYAFLGCTSLEAVTIPDSVRTIGLDAFYGCSSLKTVRIGKGVTSFGGSAFGGCTALESIYYNAVAVKNTENCDYFSGMTSGATLTVGRDVVEIPPYLFQYANITSVTFEEGSALRSIGDYAFLCTSITEVHLPAGVESIGNHAFRQCKLLTVLTMGEAVTVIGDDAFRDCSALVSLKISSGVTWIPRGLLRGCSSLVDLTVPFLGATADLTGLDVTYGYFGYIFGSDSYTGSVNVYGYGTSMSYKLYNWYIPASLRSVTVTGGTLVNRAFENCTMLTEVTLTEDVSLITEGAFGGCTGIRTLYYDLASAAVIGNYPLSGLTLNTITVGHDVKSLPDYLFYGVVATTVTFHPECELASIGEYAFASNRMTAISLPSTVTSIGEGAFSACTLLESITLPAGVTELADALFKNCTALAAVNGTVTAIGEETFYGCRALTSFGIPATMTEIPAYAFYNTGLTSVTLPAGVTRIGDYAFSSCTALTEVTCLGTVAVGSSAFSGCSNLESFTAAGVSGIGSFAFQSCSKLATLDLGAASGEIGASAFSGCSALTAVTLPEGITAIGSEAFSGTGITDLVIPDSVTSIGGSAFASSRLVSLALGSGITAIPNGMCYGLTSLETVTMAEGVESIGSNAFYGCTALKTVGFVDSITSIGENAFRSCTALSFSALPASLKTIGSSAFYGCRSITGKLTLPDSIGTVGSYAFRDCTGITEVDTGSGLGYLTWEVFGGCTSLKVVTIGTGMDYIDRRAFEGCTLTHAKFLDTASNWCYDDPSNAFNAWTIGKTKLEDPAAMATEYINKGVYDLFIE